MKIVENYKQKKRMEKIYRARLDELMTVLETQPIGSEQYNNALVEIKKIKQLQEKRKLTDMIKIDPSIIVAGITTLGSIYAINKISRNEERGDITPGYIKPLVDDTVRNNRKIF